MQFFLTKTPSSKEIHGGRPSKQKYVSVAIRIFKTGEFDGSVRLRAVFVCTQRKMDAFEIPELEVFISITVFLVSGVPF